MQRRGFLISCWRSRMWSYALWWDKKEKVCTSPEAEEAPPHPRRATGAPRCSCQRESSRRMELRPDQWRPHQGFAAAAWRQMWVPVFLTAAFMNLRKGSVWDWLNLQPCFKCHVLTESIYSSGSGESWWQGAQRGSVVVYEDVWSGREVC